MALNEYKLQRTIHQLKYCRKLFTKCPAGMCCILVSERHVMFVKIISLSKPRCTQWIIYTDVYKPTTDLVNTHTGCRFYVGYF